jgi:hypothetical protein
MSRTDISHDCACLRVALARCYYRRTLTQFHAPEETA